MIDLTTSIRKIRLNQLTEMLTSIDNNEGHFSIIPVTNFCQSLDIEYFGTEQYKSLQKFHCVDSELIDFPTATLLRNEILSLVDMPYFAL